MELPTRIPVPEWVDSPEKTNGLDLLGLRLPVQNIGNALLDGVTTVTPAIRYLSLRAWIVHSYIRCGGEDSWKSLIRFAKRVEASIAYGNLLTMDPPNGILGLHEARDALNRGGDMLPLKDLIKGSGLATYGNPSNQLGISFTQEEVPGLTLERGEPLAELVHECVRESALGEQISRGDAPDRATREDLTHLGERVHLARITPDEREALIRVLVPVEPTEAELPRVATYALLLDIAERIGHPPATDDLLLDAINGRPDSPSRLASVIDGWLSYAARDLLAIVHEGALEVLIASLATASRHGEELVHPNRAIEVALAHAHKHSTVLVDLGILRAGEDLVNVSAAEVRERLLSRLGVSKWDRVGVRRWATEPGCHEVALIRLTLGHPENALALLPVVWWLVVHRFERALAGCAEEVQRLSYRGGSRLGLEEVLLPVSEELARFPSYGAAVAELARRTVEQHLKICWSRMALDPTRDTALLITERSSWGWRKEFRGGRTRSRIEEATGWLEQLELVGSEGLSARGHHLRERAMDLVMAEGDNGPP